MTNVRNFDPEFDCVYSLDAFGTVTDSQEWGPGYVEHSDEHDIEIDGTPTKAGDWQGIKSHTGQYGYNGVVLHASEQFSPCHVDELLELSAVQPIVFVVTSVEAPCSEEEPCFPGDYAHCVESGCDAEPAGWVILAKPAK